MVAALYNALVADPRCLASGARSAWVLVSYRYLSGVVFVGVYGYMLLFMDTTGQFYRIDYDKNIEPIKETTYHRHISDYEAQIKLNIFNLCIWSSQKIDHSGYTQEEPIPTPRDETACLALLARLESGECVLALASKQTTKGHVITLRKPAVAANPVLDVLSRLCRLI